MGHSLEIQTSPSGQHVLLLGNNQGLLDPEQAPGTKLAANHFPFFTLNTAASGVHTKKETSSSPESRKLNKLTAWGPPQKGKSKPMIYHLIPVRMVIIKKTKDDKCWQRGGEKRTLAHFGRNVN